MTKKETAIKIVKSYSKFEIISVLTLGIIGLVLFIAACLPASPSHIPTTQTQQVLTVMPQSK